VEMEEERARTQRQLARAYENHRHDAV
jgi:hypothetical protein